VVAPRVTVSPAGGVSDIVDSPSFCHSTFADAVVAPVPASVKTIPLPGIVPLKHTVGLIYVPAV
jgi:hypothetical protein